MGRRKVRNFKSKKDVEESLVEYLRENKERYRRLILSVLKYDNFDDLREDEYKGKLGFDCGWVSLAPRNPEMSREWRLDNGNITDKIFDIGSEVYNTQSTKIKSIVVNQLVEDLDLDKDFIVVTTLD